MTILDKLEAKGVDVDVLAKRMMINSMLIDIIDGNGIEIGNELKKIDEYRHAHKQNIRKMKHITSKMVQDLDKQFNSEILSSDFSDGAEYLFEMIDLSLSVKFENRLKAKSTIKLLI